MSPNAQSFRQHRWEAMVEAKTGQSLVLLQKPNSIGGVRLGLWFDAAQGKSPLRTQGVHV